MLAYRRATFRAIRAAYVRAIRCRATDEPRWNLAEPRRSELGPGNLGNLAGSLNPYGQRAFEVPRPTPPVYLSTRVIAGFQSAGFEVA
jgi:hypothetical protein